MSKDKNKRGRLAKLPEGEYGEIYNTEPKRRTIADNDLGDIRNKIIIINPTNKNEK
ncbi:hypothetical protein [Marinisporobacter balticus]|uniref:Uncharacterized protein n=1 Tax=Marinisporobacter balticus TaxID=2018667 RepID=A0A4R2KY28_9FIRM|nr:hypothetical protein [Marinisporobacter balticus]TCO79541.1 hypothetical protein EV214_102266 [Marinisporobacter balticus]